MEDKRFLDINGLREFRNNLVSDTINEDIKNKHKIVPSVQATTEYMDRMIEEEIAPEIDKRLSSVTYLDGKIVTTNGTTHEVVDIQTLKSDMNLSTVATSGSYNDLIDKPDYHKITISNTEPENPVEGDIWITYEE